MNENDLGQHENKLLHRLLAADMDDERFLERFFRRHDIEEDLSLAERAGPAHYEETLESWIETAEKDYEAYGFARPEEVREGEIKPKRRRRARKPKDISTPWERQEALSRYLKEVASEDEEIIRFRERTMSGRLLSEKEALTFFASPLLADQPLFVFDGHGIDLLEKNHLLGEETDDRGSYRRLVIEGRRPKGRHPLRVQPLAARGPELVYPGDVLRLQDLLGLRVVHAITFSHPREEDRVVIARQGSIIAELVKLAQHSLEGYPISTEMGAWFILTGEFIPQDPVRLRYVTFRRPEFSRTTFTLEVEGWLPPEELLEQYRHAQSQVLGKTPRSPKRKTLSVLEFVAQHKDKSWGELFELWNKQHPNERLKDRSHLWTWHRRVLDSHLAAPRKRHTV